MDQVTELQLDPTAAFERGFNDFDFFGNLALPEKMKYRFPVLYLAIWQMLVTAHTAEQRAAIIRFALGLPRGFAKTTFIKILICWLIAYDKVMFVLVVCADEPLAYNLLSDLDDILSSENMEKVYGKWSVNKAIDNKEKKTCMYRQKPRILIAVGSNSSVRGLNLKNDRPDFILCDDMQTLDNSKSDTESQWLLEHFVGTIMKLGNPEFVMVVYIGNMYPGNCILAKLRDNKAWMSLITGCILADGSSLWPELHPVENLFESFKHDAAMGLAHIWFAEMMNDPIEAKTSLLPDGVLPECKYDEIDIKERAVGGCVIIDPAGYRVLSDENIIGVHLAMDEENMVFADGTGGVLDPEKVINQAIEYCIDYELSVIGIETVAYQQTLKFWVEKAIGARPELSHIIVVELTPAGRRKEFRIIMWFKEILAGTCHVYGAVRNKILWQALSYKLGKKDNRDDWLDDGAYVLDVRADYWDDILKTMKQINPPPLAKVRTNNTSF